MSLVKNKEVISYLATHVPKCTCSTSASQKVCRKNCNNNGSDKINYDKG